MPNLPDSKNLSYEPVDEPEISLLDLLSIIAKNLRLLILGPIVAGLISLGITYFFTPIFTAKTTIIPPSQGNSGGSGAAALLGQLGGLGALAGATSNLKMPTDQYIAYLNSNTLRDQLIEQFKLRDRYQVKYHEELRQILSNISKITADKKSGFISIQVSDRDPEFASSLANAYVSALSQMMGKMAFEDAKSRRQLLEQQLNDATEKSYRSPFVREAIIQSVVREYETAIMDQKKDRPFIQQVDVAEVPEQKSKPNRTLIAVITALGTGFGLLVFVFMRNAFINAKNSPDTKDRLQEVIANLRRQLKW